MYASLFAIGTLLATQTLAYDMLATFPGTSIGKRQDNQAFIPPTQEVHDCSDGSQLCGTSNVCYTPGLGDTCCPGGTYACPGGSFCLQDGYCCPNGLDRDTCAKKNGITLTPTSTAEPATSASSSSAISSKPVIPTSSSSTPTISGPSSSSRVQSVQTSSFPMFTGGANAKVIGGPAVVLSGLGLLGNFLI